MHYSALLLYSQIIFASGFALCIGRKFPFTGRMEEAKMKVKIFPRSPSIPSGKYIEDKSDGKYIEDESDEEAESRNLPQTWTKTERHTSKEDAISRQVFWKALITHLGKRNKMGSSVQKKCVFTPNVTTLT